MKVTVPNIGRFWHRLMFPPDTDLYKHNRLSLRSDMPWEPWLHCGVWLAMILILIKGERGVLPPIDGIDWVWLAFGLISPMIGFSSVWCLAHYQGKIRYGALWGRMISDAGLATAILLYQIDRFITHSDRSDIGVGYGVLPNVIIFMSMWFTLTLVWRDIRFIIATEQLAAEIYRGVHELRVVEWLSEWGDDAVR